MHIALLNIMYIFNEIITYFFTYFKRFYNPVKWQASHMVFI